MQQFLPDVHALVVAELGVVNEQFVAKHQFEPVGELGGKRYFGHEIEHLLTQFERIGNEMHVDGRLAARSDSVQQRDVLVVERLMNLAIGPFLFVGEHGRVNQVTAHMVKAVDFLLVDFEDATLHCCGEHCCGGVGPLEQVVLGDFEHRFAALQPVREVEVGEQQRFLLLGALHLVEEMVQSLLVVALQGEAHAGAGLGAIVVDNAFRHMNGTGIEQFAHYSLHILESCCLGDFVDLNASQIGGVTQHRLGAVAQLTGLLFLKVGVHTDKGLALHLEPAGDGGLIYLAHGAKVVVGNPLPELDLRMADDGEGVEHSKQILGPVAFRLPVVRHHHNGGVDAFFAKRDQHTTANHDRWLQFGRDVIGVSALNGKGQQDFGKLRHGNIQYYLLR